MFRTCFAKFSFRVEFPVCLLTMTYIASPLTCNTPIDPHFIFCVWLMRIVTLNLTTTCLIDSNFFFLLSFIAAWPPFHVELYNGNCNHLLYTLFTSSSALFFNRSKWGSTSGRWCRKSRPARSVIDSIDRIFKSGKLFFSFLLCTALCRAYSLSLFIKKNKKVCVCVCDDGHTHVHTVSCLN